MQDFSERLIQRVNDPAVQEEMRRSLEQRGVLGHYLAGFYRVVARPIATWQLIARARIIYFLWGMDGVANFVERLPTRYLIPVMRAFGAHIADTAVAGERTRLTTVHGRGLSPLTIGHKSFFGRRNIIDLSHEVTFGDFSTLGNDCSFVSHTDFAFSPLKLQISPMKRGPVRIGRGAFIGSNTMVAHSVTIGECVIIGANSFVDKHVPPYTFAAGTPAKVIAHIDRSKIPPFDPAQAVIIPEGSTPEDFPYDDPRALKIAPNLPTLSGE